MLKIYDRIFSELKNDVILKSNNKLLEIKKLKKKYKVLSLALIGMMTFEVTAPSFAHGNHVGYQALSKVSNYVSADDTVDNQAIDEAKLDEFIKNPKETIDIQKMDTNERENFEKMAQEEAEKAEMPTAEDTEAYKQTLIDLFDSKSDIYQNPEEATAQIIDEIDENHEDIMDKITGEKVLAASHGTISVGLAGNMLNLAISAAMGGASGAVTRALIKKVGYKQAGVVMTRVVRNKLISLGVKNAKDVSSIVNSILAATLDPGTLAARWIDQHDKIKNNGWIELW